jgi:DNA repair exonuclease SbcCD ATPase subunit
MSDEKDSIRWELNEIREELLDELDDLKEDFTDDIDDLIEDSEEIKDELREELEDLESERESLLNEIGDVREELENLGDNARERIDDAKVKLGRLRDKAYKYETKFSEKLTQKLEKAKKKAVKRINISVDPEMSDEWKDWAEGLGASVSELVRKSMKFVKNNIGDIGQLEKLGKKLEKMGDGIEKAVKNSGIEDLGEKFEKEFGKKKDDAKIKVAIVQESDKERIKKRVRGLVKLHQSIPIEKLAHALGKTTEEAENLIYELADEGIDGNIEEGVFKFTNTSNEVISKLNELIDKI